MSMQLPNDARLCNELGNRLSLDGAHEDALLAYGRAMELDPNCIDPYFNQSNCFISLARFSEALIVLDELIGFAPDFLLAHYNRGVVLQAVGRFVEAVNSYINVLRLDSGYVSAIFNMGCIQMELGDCLASLGSMDRVVSVVPDLPEAHNMRGVALLRLGAIDDARRSFDRALELRFNYEAALNNRADALVRLGRWAAALNDLNAVLKINPNRVEARYVLGRALLQGKRYDESINQLQWVFDRAPEIPLLLSEIVHAQIASCDWRGLDWNVRKLIDGINCEKIVCDPFAALGFFDEPLIQLNVVKGFFEKSFSFPGERREFDGRVNKKIKVGYYSSDFYNHATSFLMAELFERHERCRFEWYAFSMGPKIVDSMRNRLVAGFDYFIDVEGKKDVDIAAASRDLGIDIAVDLKGFTRGNRFGIFIHRCAPIQVSYLGYPGTTGAPYMDYVIADKVVIPPEMQQHFTEKVVYLPNSYQVNDGARKISERVFKKAEVGLPEEGFVFCCFNNNYKILPPVFDIWMRLLKAVPGSVLWLFQDNDSVVGNLRREAESRGVCGDRLVFAPRMPLDEHLARHRLADLFLDTLPVNAHTTASDALWAGLPLLTCAGKSFAARVAASLLHAVGLPELVTETAEDYEALALALARDPQRLQGLRQKLNEQKHTSPLFDAKRFARDIEAAYVEMHERHLKGLPPDVIEVAGLRGD